CCSHGSGSTYIF
nr:immunoglobulin light chain junction region [Macaca mulatta]MPO03646.1 immunoglobulin light chain junction region [Macaca mulatta]MPO04375.1 immunoglobulin light chain junction region [Macaca mulatta]MPO04664.1 immunoglobulin light chain junction region [Macaca mulatta]MPO04788.1 immunoglobulin light chain junction region [Macaca mulatta]